MTTIRSLTEVIDMAPVRRFHVQIFLICFATAVVDGFDNQMVGFSAAAIAVDLNIPLSAFGGIFSAGATGALIGAMSLGTIADRIGRKNALVLCTAAFAVLTGLTVFAHSAHEIVIMRFVAGIGLGGAMPGFLTLSSEYAPRARRALATGILWCGYPIGGLLGSSIGAYLIPNFGWRSVFLIGCVAAVLVALLQIALLPESTQFLALREKYHDRVRRIIARLDPTADAHSVAIMRQDTTVAGKVPVWALFTNNRLGVTLLLWLPLFCTFMISNFFVLWSPPLFRQLGYGISTAALLVALNNFAAVPSQAGTGFVIDRKGPFALIIASFVGMTLATLALAGAVHIIPVVAIMMIVIGLLQGPGIAGMLFVATRSYPAEIRSTGVGWAVGVGRTGQIVGSLIVGAEVAAKVPPQMIFAGVAVPALAAMLGALFLYRLVAKRPSEFPELQRIGRSSE